jgi:hypothetical protein
MAATTAADVAVAKRATVKMLGHVQPAEGKGRYVARTVVARARSTAPPATVLARYGSNDPDRERRDC